MAFSSYILDQYQILTYFLYQNIYKFLFFSYYSTSFVFFGILFILGFLTVFTPCFMSMLPLIFTYTYVSQHQTFSKYLCVAGIMTSICFTLFIGTSLNVYFIYSILPTFSSLFLVLVSLNLMNVTDFTFITSFFYSNFRIANGININLKGYLSGLIVGVSSIPCNTSIILLITFILKKPSSLSSLYLLIYLMGCLLPLLVIINITFDYIRLHPLLKFLEIVFPLGGSVLLLFSFFTLLRTIFLT